MNQKICFKTLASVAVLASLAVLPVSAQTTTGTAVTAANTPAIVSPQPTQSAAPVLLKLDEIDSQLREESDGQNGLWQKMILTEPDTRLVLLCFDANGTKEDHSVPGRATITVIDGAVNFDVGGTAFDMKAGDVIVLEPNVEHNLTASEKSRVLVNINMRTVQSGPGGAAASQP